MRIGPLLAHLLDLETGYAAELRAAAERHRDDHDVFHQCHTFALQCQRHAAALQPVAARYGEGVDEEGPGFWSGLLESARRAASTSIGRVPESSLLLLRDLRTLFLHAEETSITWVMAGQAAQAARDQELLDVVRECHQETEIQVKWFVTRIKVASPQALVVG